MKNIRAPDFRQKALSVLYSLLGSSSHNICKYIWQADKNNETCRIMNIS
jgi:hypothetical protein